MDNLLNKILSKFQYAVVKINSKSALNPLLWLSGVVIPTSIITFGFTGRIELLYMAVSPIILIAFAYCYFMFSNPDYLLSEHYQLEKHTLELMGEKGKEIPAEKVEELKALPKFNKVQSKLRKIKK